MASAGAAGNIGSGGGASGGGATGNAGSVGVAGSSGSLGQGGTTGASGAPGTAGAAGTTGTAGTAGMLGSTPALVTSTPGAYWKTDAQLTDVTASGTADVTVDDASAAQTWEGFGGAFNEMGWNFLSMLSQADRDLALNLLFGPEGVHFALGRIPIGATDYAMDRYTDDEVASGTDTTLASFSITRDQQKLIPFVKAAMAIKGDMRFWASPWTPPTWMKQGPYSPASVESPFDGGTLKNDAATMTAFAQYLVKWVQAYTQQGIPVDTLSAQNEPGYTGTYPTCGWTSGPYTTFIGQYLGPEMTKASLSTKLMLGTFNGGTPDAAIVSGVMGDATAKNYIKVLGFQWGMLGSVSDAKKYNLPIWQTEHKCGNYPWEAATFVKGKAPNDQAYAVESWGLIHDWIKAGVTAYATWNMVLDTVGVGIDSTRVWPQDALLTVDTSAKTLNITPTYYVFRHVSRFVYPGAKVVAATGSNTLAFKNTDGSIVAVIYNSGAAKSTTVGIGSKKLQFTLPATGWATIVSR